MTAILKREFASYFTSPLGYVYLAVFYGFSGLFLWITCLTSGSADMQYVFLWMFFIMMILIPILTMRTMADDKRQKTDQLTLTSPVSLLSARQLCLSTHLVWLRLSTVPVRVLSSAGQGSSGTSQASC